MIELYCTHKFSLDHNNISHSLHITFSQFYGWDRCSVLLIDCFLLNGGGADLAFYRRRQAASNAKKKSNLHFQTNCVTLQILFEFGARDLKGSAVVESSKRTCNRLECWVRIFFPSDFRPFFRSDHNSLQLIYKGRRNWLGLQGLQLSMIAKIYMNCKYYRW